MRGFGVSVKVGGRERERERDRRRPPWGESRASVVAAGARILG